jgi:hypothetical protein
MILPNFTRVNQNDYDAKYTDLIVPLGTIINNGFQQLYQCLQGNASLGNQQLTVLKTVTLQVDSTGKPQNPTTFSYASNTNMTTVVGCQVINAVNNSNPNTYPTGAVQISFTTQNNAVVVKNVTGLPPNTQWTLTIVAYGG